MFVESFVCGCPAWGQWLARGWEGSVSGVRKSVWCAWIGSCAYMVRGAARVVLVWTVWVGVCGMLAKVGVVIQGFEAKPCEVQASLHDTFFVSLLPALVSTFDSLFNTDLPMKYFPIPVVNIR